MPKENAEKLYGMPMWDLYSCEICGAALFKHTVALHEEYHSTEPREVKVIPPRQKVCTVCNETLLIPIEKDGSMNLEDYDNHMESHGM